MRTDSHPIHRVHRSPPGALALCWLILSATIGCQRGMYDASSLPQELNTEYIIDTQGLDLSSLASDSVNSQQINVGDTLNMTVVTGAESDEPESWPLRVDEQGTVQIPLVGPIQLAGLELQAAQDVVRRASVERGVYRQPSVAISVESRRTNRVTVMGAVPEPGEYELPVANSNLLAALAAAGSLSQEADRFVEIRQPPSPPLPAPSAANMAVRGEADGIQQVGYHEPPMAAPQVMRIDLVAATQTPRPGGYPLRDGSVVMVRRRPARFVHVMGLVEQPDQFELPPNKNVRVLDAIAMAGGRTLSVADRVFVIRPIPGSPEPALIELSVRKAKEDSNANLLLADGDVISVEETPTTFILGAFQQFIRLGVNGSVRAF